MNAIKFLVSSVVLTILSPLTAAQDIVCWFNVEVISPNVVLLLPEDASCHLHRNDYAIGSLAWSNASLGLGVGVVSAMVGSNGGWIVTLFNTIDKSDVNSSLLEWTFRRGGCWFELQDQLGFNQSEFTLDVGDRLSLQVVSLPVNFSDNNISSYLIPRHFGDIIALLENASLFHIASTVSHSELTQTLTLDLWQRPISQPTQSQVTVQLQTCQPSCYSCSLSISISSGCPMGKGLSFSYPTSPNDSNLYNLPPNYRPPSHLGVAVPISPHVYNADPTKPMHDCEFSLSQPPVYKQCQGKTSRAECECTLEQTTASDVDTSDCMQKVHRHLFANAFPLLFNMGGETENETLEMDSQMQVVIVIQEINNRTDYRVETVAQTRRIEFAGPGLFHFRAELNQTQMGSLCSLSTQFTVFVESQPLTKSEEQIISSVTAVTWGVTISLAYLVHYCLSKTKPLCVRNLQPRTPTRRRLIKQGTPVS